MGKLLVIGLGGAAGTIARYLVSEWTLTTLGPAFPYGTLSVNLIGSFLLAAIMSAAMTSESIPTTTLLVLTTGVLGGFTTYSTFSYETFRYLQQGAYGLAAINVAMTVPSCLLACVLGFATARWALG